ncbi:MAG: GNVR domain-containing protein [Candidatus Omnitrophota bacterium]|jgi:uncharacterized protein involved in exopolysaccharide biosynthesis
MIPKPQVDWQEYIQILFKRRWVFLIPLICVLVLSIVASFIMPKTYEAKATILVEEEKMVNPLLRNLAVSSSVGQRLHRLREEILSWPRLLQLVEELNLNKEVSNPLELEELILGIRKQISLTMTGKDVIVISYEDKDPHTTQEVVNTLCDILIRKNLLVQSQEADSAITFIEEQLQSYQVKLEESEQALRKFKETYGLKMPVATLINEQLAKLEAELAVALVDCTEDHPRIIGLRRHIESLKEKRNQEVEDAAKIMGDEDYKDYISIAESIPKQEEELARLTRNRQVNEQIYAMLLQRLETATITKQLESSENKTKFKIIEPARLPLKPKSPNKLKFNFLGLVIGGIVGFGSTYVAEYTDRSFKRTDDLKNMFNLPVLGSISKITTEQDIKKRKAHRRAILLLLTFIVLLLILSTFTTIKLIY